MKPKEIFYLCKKKEMNKDYTIEELANMRINNLICAIKPDDNRWTKLVEYKGWELEFNNWLKENDFDNIPKFAKKFIAYKDKQINEEQDWNNLLKSTSELENITEKLNFSLLLEKRMKQYKSKPYKGELGIGHFVGIKSSIDENPKDYENHTVGLIEDFKKNKDGNIATFVLRKFDNTIIVVQTDMTYRIY